MLDEKLISSYHESGHCIAYLYLGLEFKNVELHEQPIVHSSMKEILKEYSIIALAGSAAQERIDDSDPFFGGDAICLVKILNDKLNKNKAKILFEESEIIANNIFTDKNGDETIWWNRTEVLANELVKKESMTFIEVKELVMTVT